MVNCRVGVSGPGPRQTKGFILEVSAEHLLRAGEKPGSHPFLQDEAPSHSGSSPGALRCCDPRPPTRLPLTPASHAGRRNVPDARGRLPTPGPWLGLFVLRIPSWLPSSRGLCHLCVTSQWGLPDGTARHLLSHAASTCPLVSSSPSRVQALRGREHPMRRLALSRPSACGFSCASGILANVCIRTAVHCRCSSPLREDQRHLAISPPAPL